jgi:CHASE3 domain sensor protein
MLQDERRPLIPSRNDLKHQEQIRMKHSGIEEQEISRLRNTTAQRVFYIVVGIVLLLLLIVGILGANVFHFM